MFRYLRIEKFPNKNHADWKPDILVSTQGVKFSRCNPKKVTCFPIGNGQKKLQEMLQADSFCHHGWVNLVIIYWKYGLFCKRRSNPKYLDPSKLAILRTQPLQKTGSQVHSPFHSRVIADSWGAKCVFSNHPF